MHCWVVNWLSTWCHLFGDALKKWQWEKKRLQVNQTDDCVSVQFGHSFMSDSLWLQAFFHPGVPVHHLLPGFTQLMSIELVMPSNHLILCHPLLLPPSIFPSIRVFSDESVLHIRWPSTEVSASASILPVNIQDWSPLGCTGWISWQPKGLSRVFSNTTVQKHQFFST